MTEHRAHRILAIRRNIGLIAFDAMSPLVTEHRTNLCEGLALHVKVGERLTSRQRGTSELTA